MRTEGRFLIDTNVLIYATLPAELRYPAARNVLEQAYKTPGRAFISAQNLAEMYPTLTGPRTQPPDSPYVARRKIAVMGRLCAVEVLPLTFDVVSGALALCERQGVTRQRYYDMQLVATMRLYDIPVIVTENRKDFEGIADITALNPFSSP
jgi:predicted nucleic acid-binding protein